MLHLAIIGCGKIAEAHVKAFGHVAGARITVAVDIDGERAGRFAAEHGISRHLTDYADVMSDAGIDAIVLCVPPYLNRRIVTEAARARKHVLCEKPIALTLDDADAMLAACADAGVKLEIGFVRRFDAEWLKFRELVRGGAIGRPVTWRFAYGSSGPKVSWDLERGKGGGVIVQWGVHHFDFARFVFGPVASVKSSCRTLKDWASVSDTGTAIIEYQSGDQALVSFTWGLPEGSHTGRLNDAIGPGGAILWQESIQTESLPRNLDLVENGLFLIDRGERGKEVVTYRRNDMFYEQARHFVRAVTAGEALTVSGVDGREALATALQVLSNGGMAL